MERYNKPDFLPEKILKVYKSGTNNYYIEVHPVYNKKGKLAIGAGQPLTKKTLHKLIGVAMSDSTENIWWENPIMPQHLLSFCSEKHKRHIMWWRPKGKINMLFSEGMKLTSGLISMPAMFFFVHLDKIRIFALKENKRPILSTKLYHAPLLNVIQDNQLCWGNVSNETHDILPIDKELLMWENYLWNSKFSHAGSAITSKKPIMEIYKSLCEGKPFPMSELRNTGINVNQLIKDYETKT